MCLQTRISATANVEERRGFIDEAILHLNQAINLLSKAEPNQAWYLHLLRTLNLDYINLLFNTQDATSARQALYSRCAGILEKAFAFQQATPISRITIARTAGLCYMHLDDWGRASDILSEVVSLFPRINPLALDQDDRQRKLHGITEQSTWACVAYVKLGKPAKGVEILDAGRGIMGKLAIRQHDRLSLLKAVNASLHERYIKLREVLSISISGNENHGQDLVAQRQKDQASFEDTENQIRRLPGMENFNKNLSAGEIQQLAKEGSLASFCDADNEVFALVVTEFDDQVLPLPNLKRSEIDKRIPLIIGGNRLSLWPPSKRAMAMKKMKGLLGWLWDMAVQPVLAHLNFLQVKKMVLPRIWWITSGHLGLMPLHAAGRGSCSNVENAYHHVVSSYVSTCAALAFARECQMKVTEGHSNVTLVSVFPNFVLSTAG